MKKALIITGGYINFDKIDIEKFNYDILIAADSGYLHAEKLNLKPHIIVGDFDSSKFPTSDAQIICAPCEKDDTDTMLACNIAIEHGTNDITIIGGTGGRCDHFLSNLFMLETLKDKNIKVLLTDGENKITVLNDETAIVKNNNGYFSLFSIGECKITLSGCKYPLNNYKLTRINPSFCVSNEVVGDYATVSVVGKAYLCESVK